MAERIVDRNVVQDDAETEMRGGLSDRVYDHVLSQIVIGIFPVNHRLPTEQQLATRLGVSRPIVREGLQRLRDDGVIKSRQGAGSYVIRRPDKQVLSFDPVSSVADIQRCFTFRMAVEGEAAALAASQHNADSLRKIADALAKLDASLAGLTDGVEEDIAFHISIAIATENHFFVSTMAAITDQVRVGIGINRRLTISQPKARRLAVRDEHIAIYEAIAACDVAGARTRMRRHLENARLRLFEGDNG